MHGLAMSLGGFRQGYVAIVDEPLIGDLLDDHGLPAAAHDLLGQVIEHLGLAVLDHHLLYEFLRLIHAKAGELRACLVHATGVKAILVNLLLGLVQPGIVPS